eukprot:SAG11_NODE_4190_length_2022_cov_1.844514_1_plen_588_part_10
MGAIADLHTMSHENLERELIEYDEQDLPLRERFERLMAQKVFNQEHETPPSSAGTPQSSIASLRMKVKGRPSRLDTMPTMQQLGMQNVRAVALDGTVTVPQLRFLRRLFHQTQEASRGSRLGRDQREGLDRENFVNIFSQAFDQGREQIERIFDKLDANADGVVSCDEFLGYMVDKNTRMLKTEEAYCLVPQKVSSTVILEYGTIEKIISIPQKKLIATVAGGKDVLVWSVEGLELVHRIPTPFFPFAGSTPLIDPDFMEHMSSESDLPSSSNEQAKAQATSRVVDIAYWEDTGAGGSYKYVVVLTDNSMFRPFLTMYDVQRVFREVSSIPLSSSRNPTCLTILSDPNAADQFLVGHRDGSCASYEAPMHDAMSTKANRRQAAGPSAKLLSVHPLHSDLSLQNQQDKRAGDLITRMQVLPVLGRTKIVSTGLDGVLSVANIESMKTPMQKRTPRQGLNSFSFSARNSFFATAGIDRTVRLWNADSCSVLEALLGHKAAVVEVIVNDDLRHIMSASADHVVKIWDIRTYKCLQTFSTAAEGGHSGLRQEMTALHYDSQSRLAITSGAGVLATWAVEVTAGSVVSKQEGA